MSDLTPTIEPKETVVRMLFSVLFALITVALVAILAVVTTFALFFSLVTRRAPTDEVRRFANRTISYLYRVLRYLTYNDTVVPFPFSDFPGELDPGLPLPRHSHDASAPTNQQQFSRSDIRHQDDTGSTHFTVEKGDGRDSIAKH